MSRETLQGTTLAAFALRVQAAQLARLTFKAQRRDRLVERVRARRN
jgi:hypothetical protein